MTALTATELYYARFRELHGFADSHMRGMGYDLIHIKAISKIAAEPLSTAYCANGVRARIGTTRENRINKIARAARRERTADEALKELRALVGHTRKRIEQRPNHAAREALDDAESVLNGKRLLTRAQSHELLPALILILRRWA